MRKKQKTNGTPAGHRILTTPTTSEANFASTALHARHGHGTRNTISHCVSITFIPPSDLSSACEKKQTFSLAPSAELSTKEDKCQPKRVETIIDGLEAITWLYAWAGLSSDGSDRIWMRCNPCTRHPDGSYACSSGQERGLRRL